MILLYSWLSAIYWTPGPLNSNLIKTEKAVPNNPENKANIKYNVPISLAFEDKNHRSVHKDKLVFNIGNLASFDWWSSSLFLLFFMFQLNKTLWGWRWEAGKHQP